MTVEPGKEAVQATRIERLVWIPLDRFAWSRWGKRLVPQPVRKAAMGRAGLVGWRSLDPERNQAGRMPDDESIRLRAIWVSEAYPPSRLTDLVTGLEALGVGQGSGRRRAADHVRRYRSSPAGGASLNLGGFVRRGQGGGPDAADVELPACIKRARGWLENVTPSLTVVTIQFEIADEYLDVLEAPLRADYRTTASPTRRGWTFHGPDQQRRAAVTATLGRLTRECADWMRRYFPGAFAKGLLDGEFPSCVFLTTKQMTPFMRAPDAPNWPFGTGLDDDHSAWDSSDWPGLRLRADDDERLRAQWWLAGREGEFLTDSDDYQDAYGGATPSGWLNRISDEMCLSLMPLATELLLEGMQAEVARSRDSMGSRAADRWDFKRLDVLREDVTMFVRDVEPVARELAAKKWRARATFRPGPDHILTILADHEAERARQAEEPQRSILSRLRFALQAKPSEPTQPKIEPPPTLAKYQADSIRFRAQALLEAARQHRDALSTVSSLVAAGESYRLDRRILWLTFVFGIAAIVSMAAAILALTR